MVGKESDRVVCVLEVMMPMVKGMDNSEDFSVVYIVVPFCRGEHLGKIHTGVEITVIILLHENPSTG